MRIAFIGQKSIETHEEAGGIERHVAELARHLSGHGHEVTVYIRRRYAKNFMKKDDLGITIRFISTIYRKNLETIVYTFLATIDALFRNYDIIHYHGVGPATLAWIPRLFARKSKVVVTFHSQDRFHRKWSLIAKLYLWYGEFASCWFPHATIAVNHVIQVYARRVIRRQIIYIPNGARLETVEHDDCVKNFELMPNKYILNVSRLVRHKGQHYLIQAFRRAKRIDPKAMKDFQLVFVGAASYTSDYEQELAKLSKGANDIRFLGYQSGEALKELYAHAYLYVQPSDSEGLSMSVLEAMSFSTPVLVSDIPENLEIIHQVGFVFKKGDSDDLADRLLALVNDQKLVEAGAEGSRRLIEEQFTWEAITQKTEELYRTLRH